MNSTATAATVTGLVEHITPFDEIEEEHLAVTMSWLASTNDIFRRAKPATPQPHLVSYFVLLDQVQKRVLLVEHLLAGLWLPSGGHVEAGEHPAETVRRETREELDLDAQFLDAHQQPFFLTWAQTMGAGSHIDVSLWFLLRGCVTDEIVWDRGEFASIQWWSPSEVRNCPPKQFDPHFSRFLAKLDATGSWNESSG